VECCLISRVAELVCLARVRTSLTTTAKPRPASPARAASFDRGVDGEHIHFGCKRFNRGRHALNGLGGQRQSGSASGAERDERDGFFRDLLGFGCFAVKKIERLDQLSAVRRDIDHRFSSLERSGSDSSGPNAGCATAFRRRCCGSSEIAGDCPKSGRQFVDVILECRNCGMNQVYLSLAPPDAIELIRASSGKKITIFDDTEVATIAGNNHALLTARLRIDP
jgi:hypothetical protein